MASSKIQVVIDVKTDKVTFAGGEVKNLRQQAKLLNDELQRTKVGTQEYQLLVEAIGDVEDATRRAKTATQEIYGTLGSLPGPIGDIANNANKMVDTFKTLGTLKTTEIRAQFVNLGKDLKDAGLGFLNLIGFTKRYEANLAQLTGVTVTNTVATEANVVATEAEVTATGASVVATEADIVAKVAQTTATNTATFATRALAAAQALLPFAAIAAAIALVVYAVQKLIKAQDDAKYSAEKYNDELERGKKISDQRIKDAEFEAEMQKQRVRGFADETNLNNEIERKLLETRVEEARKAGRKAIQDLVDLGKKKFDTQEEMRKTLKAAEDAIDAADLAKKDADNKLYLFEETLNADRRVKRKEEQKKDAEDAKKEGERVAQERKNRIKKDLDDIAKNEHDAYLVTLETRKKETTEIEEKYNKEIALAKSYKKDTTTLEAAKQTELKRLKEKYAKEDEDKEKEKQEKAKQNAEKLLSIQKSLNDSLLDAMKTGTAKEKAEAKKSGEDKIAAFKKELLEAQDLKLLTAEEVAMKLAEFTKNVNDAIQNQIDNVDKKDLAKKLDDRLKLLQIQSEGLLAGTQAYFDNRRAIINASEQKELEDTELTEAEKTAIQEKYSNQRKQLREQEIASIGQTISATIDAVANLTSALASGYDEEAKTSKDAFEKRKKLQIATATMSAASGIIQILTQPSVLPSPFDWIVKGINTAALIAATIININKIKKTEFVAPDSSSSSSSSSSGSAKPIGTTFARGGLLDGPSHARGGIKTSFGELEGGEYVINRRSTASFLPLLTAINSAGNRKYENGGMMANMDTIQAMLASQPAPIVKTYVVASDMTSQQEANKRLMDLAKI